MAGKVTAIAIWLWMKPARAHALPGKAVPGRVQPADDEVFRHAEDFAAWVGRILSGHPIFLHIFDKYICIIGIIYAHDTRRTFFAPNPKIPTPHIWGCGKAGFWKLTPYFAKQC